MVHKSSALAAGSGSGTGGGTVSSITSSGGTIAVTNPTGPTTNVDVANSTANTLAGYNNSGTFSNVLIGTNLSLTGGTLNATGGGAVSSVFGRSGAVSANYGDYAFNLVSGVASVTQGGTGLQTLTAHGVLLGEGTANISAATTGIAGRLLFDQGVADPAFEAVSGDVSALSTGAFTVLQVHGVAYPASPSTNTVPVVTGTNQITYEQVPNAALANSSITVSGVSGITGGGSVALGAAITLGMADSTANTLAGYNSNGVFSGVSIGSNLSLSGGVLNGTVGPAPVSSVFGRTGAVVANYGDYGFTAISGVAAVSQGGTGLQTLTAHSVLLGEGISNVSFATTGIAARILIDQGVADPAFKVLTGDSSLASNGTMVNTAVNSVAYPASPSTNTVPVVTSSNQITYEQVPNAALLNSAITIGAQTGLAGGGSVALGSAITLSMGTSTANTLAGYNSNGVFSDVAIGSNLSLSGGTLVATAGSGAVSSVFGRTGAVIANWNDYQFNLIGGTASASQGGTGQSTLTAHAVLIGEGVSAVGFATTGIAARILVDQGNATPAFEVVSGDVSMISTGAHTVLAVHGVTYPATPSTNTVPVVTSSNVVTYETVPNAALTHSAITIGAQTGLAGGGSVALGSAITISMATGTANTLAGYNSSGVFADVSIGTNLNLTSGVLGTSNFSAGSGMTISYSTNTVGFTASGGAGVSSISNTDGSLTISPQTGAVQANLNTAHANTWTANQTLSGSSLIVNGGGGGQIQINAQPSAPVCSIDLTYDNYSGNAWVDLGYVYGSAAGNYSTDSLSGDFIIRTTGSSAGRILFAPNNQGSTNSAGFFDTNGVLNLGNNVSGGSGAPLNIQNLQSSPGNPGDIWNNGGVLNVS